MKRILAITIAATLISIIPLRIITAQSFLNMNKVWLMNEYNYSLGPNLYNHLYFVKIGADTLINGIHYRKAIQTSDTILLDWVTFGFIRETVEKKIYFKRLGWEERLMFDFNANPGDTIFDVYSRFNEGHSIVVTKIDSVELLSKKAKRITVKCIDYFPESIEWVEGVGDFKGGIIPNLEIIPGGELYSITCFYNNGELLIHRPIYEYAGYEPGIPIVFDTVDIECIYPDLQCGDTMSVFDTIWFSDTLRYYDTIRFYDTLFLTVLHDSSLSEDIVLANDLVADIYPNPVDNLLYISFNRLVNELSYVLIDNSGKQICSSKVLSLINSIQLDLSGVIPGLYFLYLRHDDFQEVFRIIIQNSKGP